MGWETEVLNHITRPIIVMEIELDSGIERYAKRDLELSSGNNIYHYDGRVDKFGSVERRISNIRGELEIADVTSILRNDDNHFSVKNFESIVNRYVTYRMGFRDSNISEMKTVYRGVVTSFNFSGLSFQITVTDPARLWFEEDFGGILDSADWEFPGPGVAGSKMPIVYGIMKGSY